MKSKKIIATIVMSVIVSVVMGIGLIGFIEKGTVYGAAVPVMWWKKDVNSDGDEWIYPRVITQDVVIGGGVATSSADAWLDVSADILHMKKASVSVSISTANLHTTNALIDGVVTGNLDMDGYIISNIGDIGTDFDTDGGLTLASGLFGTTVSASSKLEVGTDKFTVIGASGNTDIVGTLDITGLTTFVNASGSGDFEMGTNKLRIYGATGNLTMSGTFDADTAASHSFAGDLEITDDLAITDDLTVSGIINAFTLGGAITADSNDITGVDHFAGATASLSGNVDISGDIDVTGNWLTDFDATLSASHSFQGDLSIGDDLTVTGEVSWGSLGTTVDISDDTNLTVGATGIELSGDDIALTSGYGIPLTASISAWEGFYDTPSGVITAGTGLSWSTNTINLDNDFGADIGVSELTSEDFGDFTCNGTTCELDTSVSDSFDFEELVDAMTLDANLTIASATYSTTWNSDFTVSDNFTAQGTVTLPNDSVDEADILFSTACSAGNHFYLNGTNLACEADDDTTYTAGDFLTLTDTDFDVDVASVSSGDTTHLSTADDIYEWVTAQSYLTTVAYTDLTGNPSDVITAGTGISWATDTLNLDNDFGADISEDELANTDFGDFSCDGTDQGCSLDTSYLPLAGGTLTGGLFGTTASLSGVLELSDNLLLSGDEKELRLYNGSNYVAIKASTSLASDITFVLPIDDGDADEVLKTDGSGNLDWISLGAGDVTAVGDCASGLCLDGSSDGGTYITFYNIDSNKTQLIASDTASDLVITLPTATGTLTTTGNFAKDIVAGAGITGAANDVLYGADSDLTIAFDSTELTALTWSDGLSGNITHTFDASAGTDCVWTYGDNTATLTTGTFATGTAASNSFAGDLSVGDDGTVGGDFSITGDLTLTGNFLSDFDATLAASHSFAGDLSIGDDLAITGDLVFGAVTWNTGDNIDGEVIANDTIDADSLDWGAFTDLADGGAVSWGNIAAGELADDTVQADDIDTINAGRSMTWDTTNDEIDADAELYTDTKCIWFEDPTADDDFKSIWRNSTANAVTITEIWAESDQTVAFDLQIDDGTPADVNGTDINPAAGEDEDTSLSGDTTLGTDEELDLAITSVANTPTWLSICWTFTWSD